MPETACGFKSRSSHQPFLNTSVASLTTAHGALISPGNTTEYFLTGIAIWSFRKVDVPTGNTAQLVTDAALADLERQPGRGPSGAQAMAKKNDATGNRGLWRQ